MVLVIMGLLGYKKRTSFLASVTVAQISEFSLILMTMGATLGHVSKEEVTMVVLVGVITMTASTYLILYADKAYEFLKTYLSVFERKQKSETKIEPSLVYKDHIILVGADRTGKAILPYLIKHGSDFVVVDFNPKVAAALAEKDVNYVFGDINDSEIQTLAGLENASLVISTTSNFYDNLTLLESIRKKSRKPVSIVKTHTLEDAKTLYQRGANLVIVPEIISGDYIKELLKAKKVVRVGKINKQRILAK